MTSQEQPKVFLFDIGGVCVASPLQGILDYEISQGIPPGWVNYSISKSAPNGAWQKLERGEILMDAEYFKHFNKDLRDPQGWKEFWTRTMRKQGRRVATIPPIPDIDGEYLFFYIMSASRTPDPSMRPALEKLKTSGRYIIAALSNTVIFPPDHPFSRNPVDDVRHFFDVFISSAHVGLRKPEPEIYELALKELNNYAKEHATTTKRKDLGWADGVRPGEIVFLDDIGENLKVAKKAGFRTIKVNLGRTYDAVKALEELTGLRLVNNYPEASSNSEIPKVKL